MAGSNDFFDWDNIHEDDILPDGHYLMRVDSIEDGQSRTGKKMPRGRFVVEQPGELANSSLFEQYVMGTDENPMGIVQGAMGTRNFKKLVSACQVPKMTSIAQILAAVAGAKCVMHVVQYEEKDGEYKGTLRNRIAGYYKLGEREIGLIAGKKPAGATAAAPVAAPPVQQAPVQQAPPIQQPATTPPVQPQAPPPPPAPPVQPAQPAAPVQPTASTQPVQPVAPPALPAQPTPVDNLAAGRIPQVMATVQAPPGQPKVPPAGAGGSMRCMFCQKEVWGVELGPHTQHQATTGACPEPGTYVD